MGSCSEQTPSTSLSGGPVRPGFTEDFTKQRVVLVRSEPLFPIVQESGSAAHLRPKGIQRPGLAAQKQQVGSVTLRNFLHHRFAAPQSWLVKWFTLSNRSNSVCTRP